MTTAFHATPYGRFIEIQSNLRRKKLDRTNHGSTFLEGNFCNRDNVRALIQWKTTWASWKMRVVSLRIESSIISKNTNITNKIIRKVINAWQKKVYNQEWSLEELQHWLDIPVKTSHPEQLVAVYYWKKKNKKGPNSWPEIPLDVNL